MGIVEDIGEGTLKLISRVYRILTGVLKELDKTTFHSLFEKRGIDYADFTMLKAQLAALLFLISSVLYVFDFIPGRAYIILFLSGGYPILIFPRLREYYTADYNAYRDFFLGYLIVAVLLVMLKTVRPSSPPLFPNLHLVIFSFLYIALFFYLFKKKYGRDYTYGLVIKGGSPAKVKFNYDLRAGVKPSVISLSNDVGAEEGDRVIVEVESSTLNLRGRRPVRILRVEK